MGLYHLVGVLVLAISHVAFIAHNHPCLPDNYETYYLDASAVGGILSGGV